MKKTALALLLAVCLVSGLSAQTPPPQKQEAQAEDIQKNLVLVEKPQPVMDKLKAGFESITAKDSITMLSFIASDLLEGRDTASKGYHVAAEYAASLLGLWGIKPGGDKPEMGAMTAARFFGEQTTRRPPERSYLQEFAMKETVDSTTEISLDLKLGALSKSRTFRSDFDFTGMMATPGSFTAPVVFAGYGITEKKIAYDDFKNLDVKGKIVMILTEAPGKDNPESPFQKDVELKQRYAEASPMMRFRRGGDGFSKTAEISKLGAAAILQVQRSVNDSQMANSISRPRPVSDERPIIERTRRRLSLPGATQRMPWDGSPVLTISHEMANAILEAAGQKIEDLKQKIDTTLKPASMELPGTRLSVSTTAKTELVRCRNVIGYIEGSDQKLKDEVVVVGAHYDHLGSSGPYIFNGADDNGSGSVGVLNVARAMAINPEKPKRTVVFCLWTGEEKGLLGSRHYVMNPAFPLEKTVAYFNMDMISRPYDEQGIRRMARMMNIPAEHEIFKKLKPANFLPVSFSADAGFADILKNVNQHIGLDLYLREPGANERSMGGSDHASFGFAKIPWLFVITSMHDDYHQTGDSVDKASGEMIEKVSRLAYLTTCALADK
ncbi:MAG: M20/M25/M40 family metallo-hydrolase [Candidatus Aminicenantales bacterium]